jgi:hypothetical protein
VTGDPKETTLPQLRLLLWHTSLVTFLQPDSRQIFRVLGRLLNKSPDKSRISLRVEQ